MAGGANVSVALLFCDNKAYRFPNFAASKIRTANIVQQEPTNMGRALRNQKNEGLRLLMVSERVLFNACTMTCL